MQKTQYFSPLTGFQNRFSIAGALQRGSRAMLFAMSALLAFSAQAFDDLSAAQPGTYSLEKTHAYIALSYSHQGYSRPVLHFRVMDAALELASDVTASTVEVSIDPASIDSGVDEFDDHLRGDKFFDVANHPEAGFSSTSIVANDDGSYTLNGDLTAKGITKPVSLAVTFNKGGTHFQLKKPQLGFSASGVISRSDWDLGYAVPIVGDEVTLTIEVEFLGENAPAAE